MKFFELLEKRIAATGSFLCVGLDPHAKDVPEQTPAAVVAFCKRLIEATKDIACCYKPNSAFFEAVEGGDAALREVCSFSSDHSSRPSFSPPASDPDGPTVSRTRFLIFPDSRLLRPFPRTFPSSWTSREATSLPPPRPTPRPLSALAPPVLP